MPYMIVICHPDVIQRKIQYLPNRRHFHIFQTKNRCVIIANYNVDGRIRVACVQHHCFGPHERINLWHIQFRNLCACNRRKFIQIKVELFRYGIQAKSLIKN